MIHVGEKAPDFVAPGYQKGKFFGNPCMVQIHPTCIPVHGDYQSNDNWGELGNGTYGVQGYTNLANGAAVYGRHFSNSYGYLGGEINGVYGRISVEDEEFAAFHDAVDVAS